MTGCNQTAESAKRKFSGSALQQRNEKLKRSANIAPVRQGDAGCDKFAGLARVMTAAEYAANGDAVHKQIDAGREPHLLVRDAYNEGEFSNVAIYDVAIDQEKKSGLLEFDLHAGAVLIPSDTLVYWK